MNLASKLGEDIAGPGEILLTESAFGALPPGAVKAAAASVSISGLTLNYFKLLEG